VLILVGKHYSLFYELSDDEARLKKYSTDIGKFDFATQTWQTFSILPFDQAKIGKSRTSLQGQLLLLWQ
jgi:hypothetical protein